MQRSRPPDSRACVEAQDGDVIVIRDGVTWLGLIPIVVNPLHATRQVEICYEYPTLFVHAYLYDTDKPLDLERFYKGSARPTTGICY